MGAHTQRRLRKREFWHEEEGNFQKKNSEGMGLEARDFSEKFFFGNFKILCDLSCASRRLGLGGSPTPTPTNGKIGQNKAI